MVKIEEVLTGLSQNQNLSLEVQSHFAELITLFHENFSEVPLDNLKERLQTLKVGKLNRYVSNGVSQYDPLNNVLSINPERLSNSMDARHILMYELLSIITAKENYTGFNFNHQFEALNIGYTEILTNYLVGNDTDQFIHSDEIVATNLISAILGNDTLLYAYFQNNYMTLIQNLVDVELVDVTSLMNYNVSRQETGSSQLAEIENTFLKVMAKRPMSLEQLEQIDSFLVVNPSMMDAPEMYHGLERVKAEFELMKESILSSSMTSDYTK